MARVIIPIDLHRLAGPAWLRDSSTAVTGELPGYVEIWSWHTVDVCYAQIGRRGADASPKNYSERTYNQDSPRRRHCTRPEPQLMQKRSEFVRDNACGSRARTNCCRLYIALECSTGQPYYSEVVQGPHSTSQRQLASSVSSKLKSRFHFIALFHLPGFFFWPAVVFPISAHTGSTPIPPQYHYRACFSKPTASHVFT
jgi:hypothetical protein